MANRPPTVGGQAVLEGVMMRSPWRVATAVRDPEGVIRVKARPFVSLTRRVGLLKLPVLRGAVGLFEALRIGMGALSWSGEIAGEEEAGQRGWIDHAVSALVILLAFAAGIGLFMLTPYAVAGLVPRTGNQVVFHLVAGGLRILLLVGYMAAITLLRDIRRVLQYHGAEHKSIFAFESGLPLEPSSACPQSRFHPRCGTSFLLLAAVLTMIGFMALDTLIVSFAGPFRSALHRVLVHLPLLPLVAGAAYEVLR
ncbi:MAG TPA: DUF1385 domain-containing protein, partial [Bacteroidetes bacterium]|nr:DUF1385 domain-containing protein [Bacteroidota bacterium]